MTKDVDLHQERSICVSPMDLYIHISKAFMKISYRIYEIFFISADKNNSIYAIFILISDKNEKTTNSINVFI